jgi:hypothetical protein
MLRKNIVFTLLNLPFHLMMTIAEQPDTSVAAGAVAIPFADVPPKSPRPIVTLEMSKGNVP